MNKPSQKPGSGTKGLQPMPQPIVVARQVMRIALIVIQTGNEMIRVALPIIRAISGSKPRR